MEFQPGKQSMSIVAYAWFVALYSKWILSGCANMCVQVTVNETDNAFFM
jgi:hypothetical protein